MIISSLIRWWYIDGWLDQLTNIRWAFIRTADHFSIGLLLRTLFAPFRQISADETSRSAGGQLNMIIDKLISRTIGCIMRLTMVIVGTITLILLFVFSVVRMVVWAVAPVMPIIGILLMTTVGAPWILL